MDMQGIGNYNSPLFQGQYWQKSARDTTLCAQISLATENEREIDSPPPPPPPYFKYIIPGGEGGGGGESEGKEWRDAIQGTPGGIYHLSLSGTKHTQYTPLFMQERTVKGNWSDKYKDRLLYFSVHTSKHIQNS